MNIIDLEQGSEAWQEWRAGKWMASEAAVIMGCAPSWYETQTWDDLRIAKAGLAEASAETKAMWAHGHEKEDAAHALWEMESGILYPPACVESTTEPNLAASLDGLDAPPGKPIRWLEIKCPTSRAKWHQNVESFSTLPEYHQWQIAHQWGTLGDPAAICDFLIYLNDDHWSIIEINPQEHGFAEKLETLLHHWRKWATGDSGERTDNEWTWWAEEYRTRKAKADQARADVDEARDKLLELAAGEEVEGAGVKVSRMTRAGSVDLKAVEADLGFDINCYRKPAIESWTVRLTK